MFTQPHIVGATFQTTPAINKIHDIEILYLNSAKACFGHINSTF